MGLLCCVSDCIFLTYIVHFFFFLFGSTGGPLLLMELAFLLRSVGAEVTWITIQKPVDSDEVAYSLEHKMLTRGVQVSRIRYFSVLFIFDPCFETMRANFVCFCTVGVFCKRSRGCSRSSQS